MWTKPHKMFCMLDRRSYRIVKKYTKEQKIFFIKMFEAKLLEAQGYNKSSPSDLEAIILLSTLKFQELNKIIYSNNNNDMNIDK